MVHVKNESERKAEAIRFCENTIKDLQMEINSCDYVEDINGKLVYMPNSYTEEKRMFEAEKRKWEIMLDILTREYPFHLIDW